MRSIGLWEWIFGPSPPWWYSGLTPGSAHRQLSWWCLGNTMDHSWLVQEAGDGTCVGCMQSQPPPCCATTLAPLSLMGISSSGFRDLQKLLGCFRGSRPCSFPISIFRNPHLSACDMFTEEVRRGCGSDHTLGLPGGPQI